MVTLICNSIPRCLTPVWYRKHPLPVFLPIAPSFSPVSGNHCSSPNFFGNHIFRLHMYNTCLPELDLFHSVQYLFSYVLLWIRLDFKAKMYFILFMYHVCIFVYACKEKPKVEIGCPPPAFSTLYFESLFLNKLDWLASEPHASSCLLSTHPPLRLICVWNSTPVC